MNSLPTALDFETEEIVNGCGHMPKPVGVAIWQPGQDPYYLAWGHPNNNNCDVEKGVSVVRETFATQEVVCHNVKFDLSVAQYWIGLRHVKRIHDTQFLAYLEDPRRKSIHLKDLADADLDMPPTEQEELRDWLMANYAPARRAKKNWGKYIAKAPGDLVGKYAVGDVVRTVKLFELYYNRIKDDAGMLSSYEREIALCPTIIKLEHKGVKVKSEVKPVYEAH